MDHTLALILGLLSWGLGAAALIRKGSAPLSFASMVCCAAALTAECLAIRHLVRIADWAALADTMDAIATAAVVLTGVCAAQNILALLRGR